MSADSRPSGISAVLEALVLPAEITPFERDYLARMNRIAYRFFLLHPPVFIAIAYFNQTGWVDAIWLSALVLAGPMIAQAFLENPRTKTVIYGITSQLMGGLLVHFGQGPVQIEMHFYFFVLLALLAVFANPMTIVAAAVTVALHHLILWAVLPASVFNYDAPLWVVLVHALFVVLESTAAIFVARSFFDNVIGLDKIVQARTAEVRERNAAMRLVLDNVAQGFVTVDREMVVARERSKVVDDWFGEPSGPQTFPDMLTERAPAAADWFEVSFDEVLEGIMPRELTLEQLPDSFEHDGQHFRLSYRPIDDDEGELERLLVVISDCTAEVHAQKAEETQREMFALFQKVAQDKAGFLEFLVEARGLVESIRDRDNATREEVMRWIHTLKGNSSLYGLGSIAKLCHDLETRAVETDALPSKAMRIALAARWDERASRLRDLLGHVEARVELDDDDYRAFLRAVLEHKPHDELARIVAEWKYEPTAQRLGRLADQAKAVARRLGKGDVEVAIEGNDLRLPSEKWSPFWSAFVHVIRNAVDHGIEAPHEREAVGKERYGHLALKTEVKNERLVVEVQDDGPGIDWDKVREKAEEHGLPAQTHRDLQAALFANGMSTKDEVTDVSGRGVGMAAVREACESLGGKIEVLTGEGAGTTFRFVMPMRTTQQTLNPAA